MNVTIKSKFSMIIVLMIIVSMIFSYIITTGIVYSNIESRFNKLSEKKENLVKYYLEQMKVNIQNSDNMFSKDIDLINFLEGNYLDKIPRSVNGEKYLAVLEIKDKNIYYKNMIRELKKRIEGHIVTEENVEIDIIDKNGEYAVDLGKEKEIIESEENIGNIGNNEKNTVNFGLDNNGKIYVKAYTSIYNYDNKDIIGGVALKYFLDKEFFNGIKKSVDADIIVLDKNKNVMLSTFEQEKKISKINFDKDFEIGNTIYKINVIEIKTLENKNIGYIIVADNKNGVFRDIKEISVYLFALLFFVFSLIFLFSIEVIDSLVDSIKELTIKINKLRRGDFDINLGKLKKKNDEIGVLAQDFEEMVGILKNKINELQEVSQNKDDYSEKLEITNKELEKAKEKLEEKNKNIDIINKTLKNRIAEITNLYYLIISVSKDIIGEKFYNSVIRGIREGLGLKKIALFERIEDKFVLKGKIGFVFENETLTFSEQITNDFSSKEITFTEEVKKIEEFKECQNPVIISLVSERERNNKELYGFIVTDNEKEFDEQDKQSIVTYIRTIVLAFENRNLYTKLIGEITKLENTTKQLKESERFKNIFLANVSHEIKSPIVPIKGYVEMMVEGKMGEINVKQRKALLTSLKNIERLEEIIDNILNYSKIEGGKYQIIKGNFNLVRVVGEAISQLSNKIEDKKIKIIKEFRGYNFDAFGDQDAIRLVFVNLISNAIKFSRESNSVNVIVTERENIYTVSVEDEGVGIDKENLNIIFDGFKQIEEGDTRKYAGVGLGLTIVKYVLHLHGQEVRIDSILNKGTKISFDILKSEE